jgi:formamidopyrimidine-DNA glycosylase
VPELPEVEMTARLLDEELRGASVESALAPGVKAMRTFDPPLSALAGQHIQAVRRRGKHLIVDFTSELSLLIHLMSAGRLQLYEQRAGPRDRTSRLLVRLASGGELRLREFGTKQAAWAKLLHTPQLQDDEALAGLGPEAWPNPPALGELLDAPRPLHAALRDQRVIAGIGRSWADEILWEARLSPFKRASELDEQELERLRAAIVGCLGAAIEHYERALSLPIPDRLPMPLRIHRHQGEPCPRCGSKLLAVHFEDYVIAYCPACQTEGRALKDRRMSRLLK